MKRLNAFWISWWVCKLLWGLQEVRRAKWRQEGRTGLEIQEMNWLVMLFSGTCQCTWLTSHCSGFIKFNVRGEISSVLRPLTNYFVLILRLKTQTQSQPSVSYFFLQSCMTHRNIFNWSLDNKKTEVTTVSQSKRSQSVTVASTAFYTHNTNTQI